MNRNETVEHPPVTPDGLVPEFKCSDTGVDGTISCPAHHHISEERWIKDCRCMPYRLHLDNAAVKTITER